MRSTQSECKRIDDITQSEHDANTKTHGHHHSHSSALVGCSAVCLALCSCVARSRSSQTTLCVRPNGWVRPPPPSGRIPASCKSSSHDQCCEGYHDQSASVATLAGPLTNCGCCAVCNGACTPFLCNFENLQSIGKKDAVQGHGVVEGRM